MRTRTGFCTVSLVAALALVGGATIQPRASRAQTAAAPATRQIGTVKTVSGNALTLAADGGAQVSVTVAEGVRVLQLAPGSTDLKSAQPIALGDVSVGDRILVTGKSADDGSFEANRVILMKSSDIAQKNATEQTDWQRRGSGGLVSAIGGANLTVSAGARKIQVETTSATKFRRYGSDSVKFEDTKPGTLDQIQVGDQVRVRGDKSEDGLTIKAEEIVSGSFKNLAGTIATLNAAGGSLTLKDLTTKKTMTVSITSNSDLRKLPPEMAARLAARARGGAAGAQTANSPRPTGSASPSAADTSAPRSGGRSGGGDLSQMIGRLPTETLADLKSGEAVMIVATESAPGSDKLTAVTMLSGVEPILAATPSGSPALTLSPWNVGGGGGSGAEGAGSGPQ